MPHCGISINQFASQRHTCAAKEFVRPISLVVALKLRFLPGYQDLTVCTNQPNHIIGGNDDH